MRSFVPPALLPRCVALLALAFALTSCATRPRQDAAPAPPPPPSAPLRVLYIGNSYTHANNLPGFVEALAAANGQRVDSTVHLPGGRTFQRRWEEGRAAELIRAGGWDVIILQNQSYEPVGDPANMLAYAQKFAAVIAESAPRARVILYNTWAYLDLDSPAGHQKKYPATTRPATSAEMQARLDDAYRATAAAIRAELAPAGPAWALALAARPGLRLHGNDGSHPNPTGTLLAALVVHGKIFGAVAREIPAEFTLPSKAGDPAAEYVTRRFDADTRAFLAAQAAAALRATVAPPDRR